MTFDESGFCSRTTECREIDYLPVPKTAFVPEPSTPEYESSERRSSFSPCVRGRLIHLSKSEDGKLMWLPPSSTASSSLTGDIEFSRSISGSAGYDEIVAVNDSPASQSESSITRVESTDLLCYEDPETSEFGLVSSSLITNREKNGAGNREVSEDNLGIQQSSEGSESSMQSSHMENAARNKRITTLHKGLTPYLSSKLKPGKHVIGVKRNQTFIRPGQLRHWAVGNSPALASSLRGHPTPSDKGNACRTLNF